MTGPETKQTQWKVDKVDFRAYCLKRISCWSSLALAFSYNLTISTRLLVCCWHDRREHHGRRHPVWQETSAKANGSLDAVPTCPFLPLPNTLNVNIFASNNAHNVLEYLTTLSSVTPQLEFFSAPSENLKAATLLAFHYSVHNFPVNKQAKVTCIELTDAVLSILIQFPQVI